MFDDDFEVDEMSDVNVPEEDWVDYLDAMGYDDGDDDVYSYDADEQYGFQPWSGDLPN